MIEQGYFVCAASRSLQGGLFGKGPLRRLGPQPGDCAATEWKRISRAEFKSLATSWYGTDWSADIWYFRHEPAASESDVGSAVSSP
jgi:hypothetical protein